MAFLFQINFLIEEIMQRENLRTKSRRLRDLSNPFELPENTFKSMFRLNRESALDLVNSLNNFLPDGQRTTYIPNHLKVLLTLNFYGQGCYQASVGTAFHFPSSQATVSRIIKLVTNAICEHIVPREIVFPITEDEVQTTQQGFMNKFRFPGVIGCIDCTHIAIINPPENHDIYPGAVYYNRKGYTSINTQVICNSALLIISINARYPGSTHDAAIWQMSPTKEHMEQKYFEGRTNTWLLGDSGYPLQPWLMTPI